MCHRNVNVFFSYFAEGTRAERLQQLELRRIGPLASFLRNVRDFDFMFASGLFVLKADQRVPPQLSTANDAPTSSVDPSRRFSSSLLEFHANEKSE